MIEPTSEMIKYIRQIIPEFGYDDIYVKLIVDEINMLLESIIYFDQSIMTSVAPVTNMD